MPTEIGIDKSSTGGREEMLLKELYTDAQEINGGWKKLPITLSDPMRMIRMLKIIALKFSGTVL